MFFIKEYLERNCKANFIRANDNENWIMNIDLKRLQDGTRILKKGPNTPKATE